MATPKIVPRAAGEGSLGDAAYGWGAAFVTNTTTSSASQGGKLVLAANDGAVMANDHRLGVIEFKGAEDGSGTLSIGARIEAICRDAWDGSNNDADLVFYTTDGTTESAVLTLDSDKLASFASNLYIGGSTISTAGNIEVATGGSGNITLDAAGDIALEAAGNDITMDTDNLEISSATSGKPLLTLKTTNTTLNTSGELQFLKDAADTADGENLGVITWYGEDEGNNNTLFAQILGEILESDESDEQGKLEMKVANNATMVNVLTAQGNKANASTTDVTIGAGYVGTCEIYGNTTVYGNKGLTTSQDLKLTAFENTYASGAYSGEVYRYGDDETLTVGGLYFLHTDGTWDACDADTVATGASQMLGVGLGPDLEVGVLIKGLIRIPSTEILNTPGSGAVDGLPVYVSTTAGHFDFTAPSGSGDFVRIVGYAIDDESNDVLVRFDPDKSWVELS